MKAILLVLLGAAGAEALTVEVVSFGWDGNYRRGRPAPLVVRVAAEAAFRGDFELAGGPVRHVFPLDLPGRSSRELRVFLQFPAAAEASWRAGAEGGALELNAKEAGPGEVLVAVEREAVGRRADRYKADFPPGSRFFFAEFPRDASQELFAAVDAVIAKERGGDRAVWLDSLDGSGAFRARGGAVLWIGGPSPAWSGRVGSDEDPQRGEDLYAVFARPGWTRAPRPWLGRLLGFAVAPVLLAALAAVLLPMGRRAKWGACLALLAGGATAAGFAGPRSIVVRETFEVEVARGDAWDRLEVTAFTAPARTREVFSLPAGATPEPVFFSSRDALDRQVRLRHGDDGFALDAGLLPARATIAVERRSARPFAGALRADEGGAINESGRDLHGAFVIEAGRAAWIGEFPDASSRKPEGSLRVSALRSRLGPGPRRALFEFWWHRTDHGGRFLVGFADAESGDVGHRGVLVVVPLR
ncbi:MAG: hypothetical protein HYY18_03905 [Planctomycetes bacterium]|nr:hypothetical protein [Planctomycetota bacterium]